MDFSEIQVGNRVLIFRPSTNHRIAGVIGSVAAVTAVRPKSFDAGGLCFRKDGKEWRGQSRAYLIPRMDEGGIVAHPVIAAVEASSREPLAWPREDIMLAFMLSSRTEEEWLTLGLPELRRIAALLHVRLMKSA